MMVTETKLVVSCDPSEVKKDMFYLKIQEDGHLGGESEIYPLTRNDLAGLIELLRIKAEKS